MTHRTFVRGLVVALALTAPALAQSSIQFDPSFSLDPPVDPTITQDTPILIAHDDAKHLTSEGLVDTDGHDHHAGPGGFQHRTNRADSHAPIGVMADHTHKAGEWMLSYRYMVMHMDGNRDGTDRVGDSSVRGDGFMVVPTEMTMQMHMFGVMYAPTDWATISVMVPWVRNSMEHRAGAPLGSVKFKTASEGLGDIKVSGLFTLWHEGHHTLHATAGLSLPTGSITEKDRTPMGRVRLPYPMQLGSGTLDLLPGVTYAYQEAMWSAGAQVNGVIRLGRNDEDYSLGDRVAATGWFAWLWCDAFSTSVRLNYEQWGDIDGRDGSFPISGTGEFVAPTMDPDRRAGQRLDVLLGMNFYINEGPLKGHRLAIEGGMPIHQRLDGPQLETDWLFTVGWQFAW